MSFHIVFIFLYLNRRFSKCSITFYTAQICLYNIIFTIISLRENGSIKGRNNGYIKCECRHSQYDLYPIFPIDFRPIIMNNRPLFRYTPIDEIRWKIRAHTCIHVITMWSQLINTHPNLHHHHSSFTSWSSNILFNCVQQQWNSHKYFDYLSPFDT